jgi:hypothetical protein
MVSFCQNSRKIGEKKIHKNRNIPKNPKIRKLQKIGKKIPKKGIL